MPYTPTPRYRLISTIPGVADSFPRLLRNVYAQRGLPEVVPEQRHASGVYSWPEMKKKKFERMYSSRNPFGNRERVSQAVNYPQTRFSATFCSVKHAAAWSWSEGAPRSHRQDVFVRAPPARGPEKAIPPHHWP